MRVCSIDDCEKPVKARGWCNTHYQRWKVTGTTGLKPKASAYERVMRRSVADGDCTIFTGSRTPAGYGHVGIGEKGFTPAHRVVYEHHHGPIPDAMFVDHTCHNRGCVNVDHLRLLTPKGNFQAQRLRLNNTSGYRGVTASRNGRWRAQITADGKHHHLGTFDTPEEAAEVARLGRLKYHEAHSRQDENR